MQETTTPAAAETAAPATAPQTAPAASVTAAQPPGGAEGAPAPQPRAVPADPRRRQAGLQLAHWLREAAGLPGRYPGFNLTAELANRDFRRLLTAGVPMAQAYELRHLEDIKAAAAREAARVAQQQVAERIRAQGLRPRENGISSRGAVVTGTTVRDMTPAQRREIARRVQRGDTIRF